MKLGVIVYFFEELALLTKAGAPPLWQTPPLRLKPGAGRPMGHAENHRADRAGDPG